MKTLDPKGYINPYLGGIFLGIVLFLAYIAMGCGIGASTAISRVQTFLLDIIAADHVNKVFYFADFAGGDKNPLAETSVFMLAGIFLGGLLSGFFGGRLKFETRKGPRISIKTRWIAAFAGGILVGFGARLARGCTSGQGLSGSAVLAAGSWVFMLCVFIGGYALAWSARKLWN